MSTRVDVILADETSVTLGEMVAAFRHCLPVASQRQGMVTLARDPELVTILAADVLQMPVQSVRLVDQVGRFALVEYMPVADLDPDLVIYCDVGGHRFHQAIRDFQQARDRGYIHPAEWYQRAKAAARGLIAPLGALNPTPAEADFVLRWALLACARYQTT
jgi:hypothetical protein